MPIACPRCKSANPFDAKRCGNCGAELITRDDEVTLDGDAFRSMPAQVPASDLGIGTSLGSKYRILGELARGGMGVVYRAEDLRLKRTVALKFLAPELTREPAARERFIHEAQAASELDHPNICTIHEIDETPDKQMYIAMAYYPGESLRDRIQRGPLTVDEVLDIAMQLARGLEKAHQHGIIHRDIKPANILMTEDGLVKIVDFGLARLARGTRVTRVGTTLGTLAYMSPEQARGQEMDRRTDLWSLGVVLYEMLTGQLPFKGGREAAVLYSIVHDQPQRLSSLKPDMAPGLERIVQHALEKKPESRYASAEEMLDDLRAYQETLRIPATGFQLRALLRRGRQPRVAVPALILVLVVSLLGYLLVRRQARIHWARNQALPEIERLMGEGEAWRDSTAAYNLAEKAEAYIPNDPKLAGLFAKCSLKINVRTEPPGARIYMKEYKAPEKEWMFLGISPLENIRVPVGIFRWKMEKDGYETVLAAASTWDIRSGQHNPFIAYTLVRVLDKKGSLPAGMVRVSGAETEAGKLDDFYIDKYEVTNRQYKEFINAGGYRNRQYWKQKFVKDGRELTWEAAMKEFVDQTNLPGPATWQAGDYPQGQGDYPVSGVSWYEAAAYAEFAGKSLPTRHHWGMALGVYTPLIRWPQLGGSVVFAPFSNFKGKGPVAVGSLSGMTSYGAFDLAGNVREWCWNETRKGRVLRGGAWDDNSYMYDSSSQAPPMDRSPRNGFRCALYPDPGKVPAAAFQRAEFGEATDYYKAKPVPDSVFKVYQEQFSYDKTDLKARVESSQPSPEGWIQEKVSFEAAYGGERVLAYLFLPRNTPPPYQAVIYFPGSESVNQRSSQGLESYYEFPVFLSFLVKNGRAVLYPVYRGTFERGSDALAAIEFSDGSSHQYSELLVQQVKDFRRCIDYLETRKDIDTSKLAFYGMSWGGQLGAIIPAVEPRLKASVLVAGGLLLPGRPEVNQINYVTRVKTPTLMLNGKYDTIMPLETSSKPMFDLLATPPEHKRQKLYDTDHIPPKNEFIKETLAWLDRYLGPVK